MFVKIRHVSFYVLMTKDSVTSKGKDVTHTLYDDDLLMNNVKIKTTNQLPCETFYFLNFVFLL